MMKRMLALTVVVLLTAVIVLACGVSQGIEGRVYDNVYGDPITDITIILKDLGNMRKPAIEVTPDKNGYYSISVEPGRYRIETDDDKLDYKRFIKPITVEDGVLEYDLPVEPIVKTWIHGLVAQREENKKPQNDYKKLISNAVIEIDGKTATTDEEGNFEIKYLRPGLKKVTITADGYKLYTRAYNLSKGETIEYFEIEPVVGEGQSLVSSLKNLVSFKMEILVGSSANEISSSYSGTVLMLPFSYEMESTAGKYKYSGSMYRKFDESSSEYSNVDASEMSELDSMIKDSLSLLDDIGYEISSTEGMKLGDSIGNQSGYSCSSYSTKYTDSDNETFDVTLWVIIDGNLETYPVKLSMKGDKSYFEVNLFAFNSFENNSILN